MAGDFPVSWLQVNTAESEVQARSSTPVRPIVIPAKAGIQKFLIFLDSGSRYPGL